MEVSNIEIIHSSNADEVLNIVRDCLFERDTTLNHGDPRQYIGQYYTIEFLFDSLNKTKQAQIQYAIFQFLTELYSLDTRTVWLSKSDDSLSVGRPPVHDLLMLSMELGNGAIYQEIEGLVESTLFSDNKKVRDRLELAKSYLESKIR